MTKICGEWKGAVNVKKTEYSQTASGGIGGPTTYTEISTFSVIAIGDRMLGNARTVNAALGQAVSEVPNGEQVCLFVYTHLLGNLRIIGLKSKTGRSFTMPFSGLLLGLLWYGVVSPFMVGMPVALILGFLGSLASKRAAAQGVLIAVLFAVGISWLTGYRLVKAYREMTAS